MMNRELTIDEINAWETLWRTMKPGTLFIVEIPNQEPQTLYMMKPNHNHYTDGMLFRSKTGTIHHHSEYFRIVDGVDAVKNCIRLELKGDDDNGC